MAGLRSFPEACLGKMLSFIKFCYQVHHIGGRIQFFPALSVCVCTLSPFSCVRLFATLWAVAHQAPLSVGFSRQEHWSGLQCPPPQLWDRGPFFLAGYCLEIPSAPRGHPWVLAMWAVSSTHNLLLQGQQEGFTVSLPVGISSFRKGPIPHLMTHLIRAGSPRIIILTNSKSVY